MKFPVARRHDVQPYDPLVQRLSAHQSMFISLRKLRHLLGTLGLATLSRPGRLYRPGDLLVNCLLGLRGEFRAHRREQRVELSKPFVCTIRLFNAN